MRRSIMKKIIIAFPFLLVFIAYTAVPVLSQENQMGQLFAIHEDVVIPAKVHKYEKAAKGLASALEEHQIKTMFYNTANTSDFTYIYVTPVNRLADIDVMDAAFGELMEKMGEKAFEKTMDQFTDCYDSHRNYMIRLRSDLSYNPEYGYNPEDGMNYRKWEFFHAYPGKEGQMRTVLEKWKALYTKHSIQGGYRIYQGEMGTDMPLIVVVESAKDAVDFATKRQQVIDKLGQEGEDLWNETIALTRKLEFKTGMMRPDLSYTSGRVVSVTETGK